MKVQQKYNLARKCYFGHKIMHLLIAALLLLMSNHAVLALPVNEDVEVKKLFKDAIWQLNSTNGSSDRFNNCCNRIIKLTKYDFYLQQQILEESFSQIRGLLKRGDYEKVQKLLSFAIRLVPTDDQAIETMVMLKAKLGKFDDIEPLLMQYFNLFSINEKSWWHFNLDKAKILTYAAKACEKYSNTDQAEHFYRLAIQQTTYPIPSFMWGEWDNVADKCYYWARMYNQACLGQLLADSDDKSVGVSILSTVKNGLNHDHPLTRNANPESKSYFNNLFIWVCALEWKKNRDKTYAMLGMIPKDDPVI